MPKIQDKKLPPTIGPRGCKHHTLVDVCDKKCPSLPLAHIAYHNGELFTEFGPCLCGGSQSEPCWSCQKANEIEAAGLDWETEYQKWRKARASK